MLPSNNYHNQCKLDNINTTGTSMAVVRLSKRQTSRQVDTQTVTHTDDQRRERGRPVCSVCVCARALCVYVLCVCAVCCVCVCAVCVCAACALLCSVCVYVLCVQCVCSVCGGVGEGSCTYTGMQWISWMAVHPVILKDDLFLSRVGLEGESEQFSARLPGNIPVDPHRSLWWKTL